MSFDTWLAEQRQILQTAGLIKPEQQQRGKLSGGRLELNHVCDQCGRHRGSGNHTQCSKQRQAMYAGRSNPRSSK